jgi:hypothetical protein
MDKRDPHYHLGNVSLYSQKEFSKVYPNEAALAGLDNNAVKIHSRELGISLSGGGMRSASFSIGALAGFNQTGLLQKADYISTVSGGGYAGYWLMSQLHYQPELLTLQNWDLLFNDCYSGELEDTSPPNRYHQNCGS